MKSLALRVAAVVLAVVALAAAGFVVFTTAPKADAVLAGQRAFEADVAHLQAVVADLRAAIPAYLAPAQDESFWVKHVAELARDLDTRLKALERPGIGTATSQEIGTAEEAASTLRQYDERLQELLRQDRRAEASRLVFSDVNALASAASVALSQAATLERTSAEDEVASLRRRQLTTLGIAAAIALLALLLLLPVPARAAQAGADEGAGHAAAGDGTRLLGAPLELDSLGRSGFDLDLDRISTSESDDEPDQAPRAPAPAPIVPATRASTPPVAPSPATPPSPPLAGPAPAADPSPSAQAADAEPAFAWAHPGARTPQPAAADLAEAARLCTELAQVSDTDQLRQLLGRAVTLLHASGIVVWLGGVNGARLRPAFSHGYSQQALARMEGIDRGDENAVSAAYRSGRLQAVAADDRRTSALVAPLLAPAGCVGAMAVEIAAGAEQDAGLRALAQLVAAQLATLMPTDS